MSTTPESAGAKLSAALKRSIHEHWRAFLVEGIVLLVLGLVAIALPVLGGLVATVFLGWVFLIAGVVGLVATLHARGAPGFGWALLSALAAIAAGVILLWNPFEGLITLTFVLIAFFIVDGVIMIALAIAHRRELTGKWEWMMVNGVIDLVLAAIVISGLPGTLLWALGLLVGIDLVFGGAALVAIALEARKDG